MLAALRAYIAIGMALADSAGWAQQPPPAPPDIAASDIVVRASRGPARQRLPAMGYFRKYCLDAARLAGAPSTPENDLDWLPIDTSLRAKLHITDSDAPALGLDRDADGHSLIMYGQQKVGPLGTTEQHCMMIVIDGADHATLINQISSMMGGGGTQRHVGSAVGSPKVKGWQQWLWSAIPNRRSKNWKVYNDGRNIPAGGTWVVVTAPTFYDEYNYVFVDLKTKRETDRVISIVSLGFIHR